MDTDGRRTFGGKLLLLLPLLPVKRKTTAMRKAAVKARYRLPARRLPAAPRRYIGENILPTACLPPSAGVAKNKGARRQRRCVFPSLSLNRLTLHSLLQDFPFQHEAHKIIPHHPFFLRVGVYIATRIVSLFPPLAVCYLAHSVVLSRSLGLSLAI